jgi:hypothetical protein
LAQDSVRASAARDALGVSDVSAIESCVAIGAIDDKAGVATADAAGVAIADAAGDAAELSGNSRSGSSGEC